MSVEAIGEQVLRDLEAVLTAEQKLELLCRWEYEALHYLNPEGAYRDHLDEADQNARFALELCLKDLLRCFVGGKIEDHYGRRLLDREEAEALAEEVLAEIEKPRSSTSVEVQTVAAKFRSGSLLAGLKLLLSVDEIVDWEAHKDIPKLDDIF